MKLVFIDEDSVNALKTNLPQMAKLYALSENSWIEKYFGESPFRDTKYTIDDFSLDMSQEKTYLTDFENVKRIYTRLSFLSDSQASDERLWTGLCLGPFWKYVQYRWKISSKCVPSNIEQHYFFGFGARRSLTRNALARLWWIGRLTYDSQRDNPYELTQFICENADYIVHILERNTSNNPMIVGAFVSAVLAARAEGIVINTEVVGSLAKYLNLLGGTYILDCLPPEIIYSKILEKAKAL